MNPMSPITPGSFQQKKKPDEEDPRLSLKERNRQRSQKLVKDALAQATSAGQSSAYATPQFEAPGLQPLQPLGDFNTQGGSGMPNVGNYDPDNTDSDGAMGLDSRFSSNVEQMMRDAPGSVNIYSGRRSTDRQAELWEQALKKYGSESAARKWVAPPRGHRLSDGSVAQGSRHESGLAADLKFENDATRQWVHENAHRYGLHFPLDNEDWHVEPIGSRG